MDYYAYDKVTGEIIEKRAARIVPGREALDDADSKKWLLPRNATTEAPPSADPGHVVRRDVESGVWEQDEDHRGETVYDKATGAERKIGDKELGPLPDDVTIMKPGTTDKWDEPLGQWVEDSVLRAERDQQERIAAAQEAARKRLANDPEDELSVADVAIVLGLRGV